VRKTGGFCCGDALKEVKRVKDVKMTGTTTRVRFTASLLHGSKSKEPWKNMKSMKVGLILGFPKRSSCPSWFIALGAS
jgi:hypothetical protein